jgi:hypothetical protein
VGAFDRREAELANDAFHALINEAASDRTVGTKLMAIAANQSCVHTCHTCRRVEFNA